MELLPILFGSEEEASTSFQTVIQSQLRFYADHTSLKVDKLQEKAASNTLLAMLLSRHDHDPIQSRIGIEATKALAEQASKLGAWDYVYKNQLHRSGSQFYEETFLERAWIQLDLTKEQEAKIKRLNMQTNQVRLLALQRAAAGLNMPQWLEYPLVGASVEAFMCALDEEQVLLFSRWCKRNKAGIESLPYYDEAFM